MMAVNSLGGRYLSQAFDDFLSHLINASSFFYPMVGYQTTVSYTTNFASLCSTRLSSPLVVTSLPLRLDFFGY